MKEKIYDILAKHFLNQTNPEEERAIDNYKTSHSEEYSLLKKFFENKNVSTKSFDSQKAWKKVLDKYNSRATSETKVIPMYQQFSRMAAAAIVLFGLLTAAYFYFGNTSESQRKMIFAAGNMQNKILLSDGSIVWLNTNGKLSYPDHFPNENRIVVLQGEAFFEVTKNPKKPFIVQTKNADIKVLGTSFNVNSQTEKTEVSVNTGTVQVQSNFSASYVTITKGYFAKADETEIISYPISNQNYKSWKTGIFTFSQASLKTVAKDLNTFYNKKITLPSDMELDCGLTAKFDNVPLEDIIEVIKFTCNVSIHETKDGYSISR
jgi:transmembrane sensor